MDQNAGMEIEKQWLESSLEDVDLYSNQAYPRILELPISGYKPRLLLEGHVQIAARPNWRVDDF